LASQAFASTTPEPFTQQALNALHIHRICLHVLAHLALGALAFLTLQVTAAMLASAQLSFAGDPETFGCALCVFSFGITNPFSTTPPNRTS